jgi:hypothetical protein
LATSKTVKGALIGGVAVIIAALIPVYFHTRNKTAEFSKVLAGNVVELNSKLPIGRATVNIVGRADQGTTDDNGYFHITLPADAPDEVRLQVSAHGFNPIDRAYAVSDHLYIGLTKR